MPLGPVMMDITGLNLTTDDCDRLLHPAIGGVILFARNYQNRDQLVKLVSQIKAVRTPSLLVAVDQEGGRVQRFKDGFTRLPPAAQFGELWQQDKQTAPMHAFESAYTMARELLDVGVDFSFAPVFDVTSENSEVIGDRCFHPDPQIAKELLGAYIDGMHTAGMVAIAKHFPGHGGVSGDSHHCLPSDCRTLTEIMDHDIEPYRELVHEIQGVMSAHVLFHNCDPDIPTYSAYWLQEVLREKLQFGGVVFSDDLSMQAAIDASGTEDTAILASVQKALSAGCDMVLICNNHALLDEVLDGLYFKPSQLLTTKLISLSARQGG